MTVFPTTTEIKSLATFYALLHLQEIIFAKWQPFGARHKNKRNTISSLLSLV